LEAQQAINQHGEKKSMRSDLLLFQESCALVHVFLASHEMSKMFAWHLMQL
jgi:hypothetical protein